MTTMTTLAMPPVPLLQVICFSMDRIFQLSEYLRTLQRYLRYRGANWTSTDAPFARAAVICRCTTAEIRAHYEAIERRYASHHVTFVYESETQSFADCLLRSIATGGQPQEAQGTSACPYVLFNVDDAFYFDDVELADAFAFLDGEASDAAAPFAFHVKLAPSIWRSHMTNQPMLPLPPMTTVMRRSGDRESTTAATVPLVPAYHIFEPARGTLDWNYPWELSGSVYTRASVERIVTAIQATNGTDGINHPNHLELRGHQALEQQQRSSPTRLLCACSLSPKMHVFAINQVQDVYQNRLYDLQTSGGDLTDLLALYEANETLDERYYRDRRLTSVHIGTLVLAPRTPIEPTVSTVLTEPNDVLVSVVIPVFNVAPFIEQALRSVMEQTHRHLEIVVVDDASTDETPAIVKRLQALDARIQLLENVTNSGVAASLNRALGVARGAFIARMDGDDVSLPHRIERQLRYLQATPDVGIIGASVFIQRGHERPGDTPVVQLETAVYPTSPLVTKWRMLFGCFLGHPTVMLRRSVLDALLAADNSAQGVYATTQRSSEDYELWLRCLYRHGVMIQSMGDALVLHRKHAHNVSSTRRDEQVSETQAIAATYIETIVAGAAARDTTSASVAPLFDVALSTSVQDLEAAIRVLHALESEVCASISSTSSAQDDNLVCERAYVSQDAASREGELALQAMVLDPMRGAQLWASFAKRHPQVSRNAFEKLFKR